MVYIASIAIVHYGGIFGNGLLYKGMGYILSKRTDRVPDPSAFLPIMGRRGGYEQMAVLFIYLLFK
jgi:hypothetical protein